MGGEAILTARDVEALAGAFQKSAVILAGVELGLFTALSGAALTSEQAARAVGADPRAVDRLLRALVQLGLVAVQGATFGNSPAAERLLSETSPDFLAGLKHMANLYRGWGGLSRAVRAGGAVRERSLEDSDAESFIAAMHHRAKATAPALAAALGLGGVRRVLDVGGGSGAFSMAFCRAEPGLSTVILDLPHVLELTREYLAAEGLSGRVALLPGDYLDTDFGNGFDLVFFSAIIHINTPEQNRQLLSKAFRALLPGGRAAVQDFVMDEDRMRPERGVFFALNMLVNTSGGDTYTESEIRAWLDAAGFTRAERTNTGPTTAMITAVKPG